MLARVSAGPAHRVVVATRDIDVIHVLACIRGITVRGLVNPKGKIAVIEIAHEPDALANALHHPGALGTRIVHSPGALVFPVFPGEAGAILEKAVCRKRPYDFIGAFPYGECGMILHRLDGLPQRVGCSLLDGKRYPTHHSVFVGTIERFAVAAQDKIDSGTSHRSERFIVLGMFVESDGKSRFSGGVRE